MTDTHDDQTDEQTISLEEIEQIKTEDAVSQVREGALDAELEAMYRQLLTPFPRHHHGTLEKGKQKLTYIDARSVDERLDEVFGWQNWYPSYLVIDERTCAVECTLHVILPNGREISRSDTGYPNNETENGKPAARGGSGTPLKDAYSNARKRAAVGFGIGRYLYPYPGAKNMTRAQADRQAQQATQGSAPPAQVAPAARPAPAQQPAAQTKAGKGKAATWQECVTLAQQISGGDDDDAAKVLLRDTIRKLKFKVSDSASLTPEMTQAVYHELAKAQQAAA